MKDQTPRRIGLLISKHLGLSCFEALVAAVPEQIAFVVTLSDLDDPRSAHDQIVATARARGIPCTVALTREESERVITESDADLCLAVCWYWFMSGRVRERMPLGIVGIHNSLLPKYRGGSPLVWALINGERLVGVSLFTLAASMDTGDIWAQETVEVERHDYVEDVLRKLEAKSIDIVRTALPAVLHGQIQPVVQHHTQASYCAQRTASDGQIDWNWPAERIRNFIRAQSIPYPGAFTQIDSRRLTIWRADVLDRPHYGRPGQVVRTDGLSALVATADAKALVLQQVSVDGEAVQPSKICRPGKSLGLTVPDA